MAEENGPPAIRMGVPIVFVVREYRKFLGWVDRMGVGLGVFLGDCGGEVTIGRKSQGRLFQCGVLVVAVGVVSV